jgi:hypothetical protein
MLNEESLARISKFMPSSVVAAATAAAYPIKPMPLGFMSNLLLDHHQSPNQHVMDHAGCFKLSQTQITSHNNHQQHNPFNPLNTAAAAAAAFAFYGTFFQHQNQQQQQPMDSTGAGVAHPSLASTKLLLNQSQR